MEIVIKIPEAFEGHFNQDRFNDSLERILEDCKHSAILSGNYEFETIEMLIKAFENGTPLPKGHGRLIDESLLIEDMKCIYKAANELMALGFAESCIEHIPTIIEADGGGEDENNSGC